MCYDMEFICRRRIILSDTILCCLFIWYACMYSYFLILFFWLLSTLFPGIRKFTLLENPQAMRLKKLGLIGSKKKFLRQPTQKELDDALIVPETSLLGSIVKTVGGIVGVVGLGFGYTQIPDENRKQIETKAKQVTTKFSETFLEQK